MNKIELNNIKLILQGKYNLVVISKYKFYLFDTEKRLNILIDYEFYSFLYNNGIIRLYGGNFEIDEQEYGRTNHWKEQLKQLRSKYPELFRKEKIEKIL